MTADELRRAYIEFFVSKGHVKIPSASLVPENDPSVLFTTAGMHPLVPYLKGEPHPAGTRLVNVQKCLRTGDIDEVGDDTHLTFFEMLGNWSLGDYFKKETIEWSFEFLTKQLGIPVEKLAVTVFAGNDEMGVGRDDESFELWRTLGVPKERIAFLGTDDNWWPAGGKNPGPQGPDTEMFYWTGSDPAPETFDPKDKRWVEIWNDVFMQFNRTQDGHFESLKQQNVDTGMGLERTLAVLNGKKSVYDTEVFIGMLKIVEDQSGKLYANSTEEDRRRFRIIVDHVKAAVFIIADGVQPSNAEQGYVLRRLIRRVMIKKRGFITTNGDVFGLLTTAVIKFYGDAYPLLKDVATHNRIRKTLYDEEIRFEKTIERGLYQVDKLLSRKDDLSGEDAFHLFSSFGFPIEITEELMHERGKEVDRKVFHTEFEKHRALSRTGAGKKFAGGLADHSAESKMLHTATHLLHQALRTVLGEHVMQKGSNITQERLRIDFSHDARLTDEQRNEVERMVNEQIKKDLPVSFEVLTVDEAKRKGAIGLFEDTYANIGGKVKMYTVGSEATEIFSREICGGPHVDNTGVLKAFVIIKEEASSAGVRRIKAVVGDEAKRRLTNGKR